MTKLKDSTIANGWYYVSGVTDGPICGPNQYSGGWVHVSRYSNIRIDFYAAAIDPIHFVCYCVNGTWSEWDCVNPPMQPGVEYRTTERYLGKPVYVKLIDLGALPNAALTEVWCGVAGATEVIDYRVVTSNAGATSFTNGALVPFVSGSYADINGDGNIKFGLTTDRDATHLTAKLLIKYVKRGG